MSSLHSINYFFGKQKHLNFMRSYLFTVSMVSQATEVPLRKSLPVSIPPSIFCCFLQQFQSSEPYIKVFDLFGLILHSERWVSYLPSMCEYPVPRCHNEAAFSLMYILASLLTIARLQNMCLYVCHLFYCIDLQRSMFVLVPRCVCCAWMYIHIQRPGLFSSVPFHLGF